MTIRILAVDDSETMRQQVKLALRAEGFNVTMASGGFEALELAKASAFDLIITDINMLDMTGLDLASALRRDPDYEHVPIFVLSIEASRDLKKRAREIGVTAWIIKPFDQAALGATIRRVVNRTKAG